MPRKSKSEALNSQNEALNSKINPLGEGEDPAVRDLLQGKINKASNLDAVELALALQQIIRGNESLMEQVKLQGEEGRKASEAISHIKEHMAKVDKALEAYQNNQDGFIQNVLDEAEKRRATGSEKDKLIAKGSLGMQNAMKEVAAKNAADLLKFHYELEGMPKIPVVSPGKLEMVNANGHMESRLFNEEVKIKDKTWILEPGVPSMVPEIVARVLEGRRKMEAETRERQALMSEGPQMKTAKEVAEKQQEISRKYGTHMDDVPVPENM